MKNRPLAIFFVCGLIALLVVVVLFLGSVTGYTPASFLQTFFGGCASTSGAQSDEAFGFAFVDAETDEAIACKEVIVYEEDGLCVNSPCPKYNPVYRGRTSQEGFLPVPKTSIDGYVLAPDLATGGPPRQLADPRYGFDEEDYDPVMHKYSELNSADQAKPIRIEMTRGDKAVSF